MRILIVLLLYMFVGYLLGMQHNRAAFPANPAQANWRDDSVQAWVFVWPVKLVMVYWPEIKSTLNRS